MKIAGNRTIALGSLTTTAAVLIALAYHRRSKRNLAGSDEEKKERLKALPCAPIGRWACLKALRPAKILSKMTEWAYMLDFPAAFEIKMLLGKSIIVITDPYLAREVLGDRSSRKPERVYGAMASVSGVNILSQTDEKMWIQQRKGVAPAFSSKHVKRMDQICEKHIEDWIQNRLEPMIDRNEAFDPADEMMKLATAVIFEAAFDQDTSEKDMNTLTDMISTSTVEISKRMSVPSRKWVAKFLPESRRAVRATNWSHKFGRSLLDAHRNNPSPTVGTVLDQIDKNSCYHNDEEKIRDVILCIAAGYDTTGLSLAWTLFELARHPEEHEKLLSALSDIPESEWSSSQALQNIVKESLRLYPVAPLGSPRTTGRDFVTRDGTIIQKGKIAMAPRTILHRLPVVFARPDDFLPDRWTKATGEMNAAFMPFSAGPRNCVGRSLALVEMHTVIAKLAGKYRFDIVRDCHAEYSILYRPAGGLIRARRK